MQLLRGKILLLSKNGSELASSLCVVVSIGVWSLVCLHLGRLPTKYVNISVVFVGFL